MSVVNQLDDIRRQNRSKILSCLRVHGGMSRTAIAGRTKLSAATVTTITADMLATGILTRAEELIDTTGGRGRPRVNLHFNSQFACVGVIALRLNQLFVSIVDYCGNTIYENEISLVTTSISTDKLLTILTNALRAGLDQIPGSDRNLVHVGVCVQGTTDVSGTSMLWSPVIEPRNVPIGKHLESKFGASVSVHNDCNIVAKALRHNEPEIFQNDFAAVLLSHGIGIGLFQNGELVQGRSSSGTEFGHMTYIPQGALCRCGRLGCIEAYAGGYSIYRNAEKIDPATMPKDDIKVEELDDILARARANDPAAMYSFEQAGAAIGTGLANLFALIDPFPIAIVGFGAKARDQLEPPIRKSIGQSRMHHEEKEVPILFYEDENPFIRKGCAVTALIAVDETISSRQRRKRIADIA
jgi:predicted NBD/HSP70 family sugar kinase